MQGYSHVRLNKPNQDRFLFFCDEENGLPIILAISDGHGGSGYFRSDKGAQFAVESAVEMCKQFLLKNTDLEISKSFSQKRLKETLCRSITDEWNKKVTKDIQDHPLPDFNDVEKNEIVKSKRPVEPDISTPYGATLLIVIITKSELIFLHLGDGDIIVFSTNGDSIRPLPRDPRLIGNETTSLCAREAWDDFITSAMRIDSILPVLIMASTDGYANSYSDDVSFIKVGKDVLTLVCGDKAGIDAGFDNVESSLPEWLNETSEKGSGDDITVGFIGYKPAITNYLDQKNSLEIEESLSDI